MNNMEEFKLDEKDKKILIELQKNSRQSFSKIGKSVGLPKTVVAYRFKRMTQAGFLTLFCAVINKKKFGYIQSRLFLKFHNFNEKQEKNLLDFLKKQAGIHWVATLNGCYDFAITILSRNIEELNSTYSQIIYNFSNYLLEKELSIQTKSQYFPLRNVFDNQITKKSIKNKESKSFKLSETDTKIINLIKEDSRIPLLDISEKLNLSVQTTRSRIKGMIKNNIIQSFRIRVNHKMLGYHHFHTFLSLSDLNEEKEKKIISFLSQFSSTINITKGTGKYDLEFESLIKSHFELYEIISKIKNAFPENIRDTNSALIYKIHPINTVKYFLKI